MPRRWEGYALEAKEKLERGSRLNFSLDFSENAFLIRREGHDGLDPDPALWAPGGPRDDRAPREGVDGVPRTG